MRTLKSFLPAMALLLAPAAAPAQQDELRDPDLAERMDIAAKAYHLIRANFAHAEGLPPAYDFEARYRQYLAEAIAAPDRKAFTLASMRFFSSLRNGHTGFIDRKLFVTGGQVPFLAGKVEGRWIVIQSFSPQFAPGDVIETVDGTPVDEWLEPLRNVVGKSNRAAEDRILWQLGFLMPERFTLGLDGGRQVPVDKTKRPGGPIEPRGRKIAQATERTERADGLVVITIPRFDQRQFEEAAIEAVRATAEDTPILIDLRGNGGGSSPEYLLAAIMTEPYRGSVYVTPTSVAEDSARAYYDGVEQQLPARMLRFGPDLVQPEPDAWGGRIALLVDGGCGSACEDFVMRFKEARRGPVIGETTNGSTGQPYIVDLPEFGINFRVSTKREYFPDGSQFEGVGIAPNVEIPLTIAEIREGQDTQLEAAVGIALGR